MRMVRIGGVRIGDLGRGGAGGERSAGQVWVRQGLAGTVFPSSTQEHHHEVASMETGV